MEKEFKTLVQSNIVTHEQHNVWQSDMKSLATVQACLTEFMAMQTAFDQVNYKAITNLQTTTDEKDNMTTIPEKS